MQVCTSLQTDNHTSTPPLSFYRPDALPAAQPTVSKHWRWILCSNIITEIALVLWTRQWRCLEQSWSRDTIVMWVFSAAVSICYCLAKMQTKSWCIVCTVADVFFQSHNVWIVKMHSAMHSMLFGYSNSATSVSSSKASVLVIFLIMPPALGVHFGIMRPICLSILCPMVQLPRLWAHWLPAA